MQAIPSTQSGAEAVAARRATGAMFFAVFGAVWLTAWALHADAGPASWLAIGVLTCVLIGMARQRYRRHAPALAQEQDSPQRRRAERVFKVVNTGQWIVIVVLAMVLGNTGLGAWIIPMAIAVIGLHFLPLAVVFHNPPHYLTGAAMVALAILYPLLSSAGPASPAGFLGAGLILWLSAAWALRPGLVAAAS